MNTFLTFLVWCLLLVLCWPLAILAVLAFPILWLLTLPLRLLGVCLDAFFATVSAIITLPARLLGWRPA